MSTWLPQVDASRNLQPAAKSQTSAAMNDTIAPSEEVLGGPEHQYIGGATLGTIRTGFS
jgi:hypothetical protein